MRLGVMMPFGDIGGDSSTVRDYALATAEQGFTNLGLADHLAAQQKFRDAVAGIL